MEISKKQTLRKDAPETKKEKILKAYAEKAKAKPLTDKERLKRIEECLGIE